MTKKEISSILAGATSEETARIADKIKDKSEIRIIKPPQKTLVMVKVRESVKQSLFYLGEVLASECMVMVDDKRGNSVLAGDDFAKVENAAIIDGYMNKKDEKENKKIEDILFRYKQNQEKKREHLNGEILKSKVNFNVMGEN